MAARCDGGFLLAALLLGLLQTTSTFEVKDGGETCILANFSAQFIVESHTKTKVEIHTFSLPENAEVLKNSTCGKHNATSSVLEVGFGNGNSLSMTFKKSNNSYSVDTLIFRYNLSDTTIFKNSTGGIKEVTAKTDIQANLNTKYKCVSSEQINMTDVSILLSNVTLEAYLVNNTFSLKETICSKDQGSTTVPPKTTAPTTSRPPTTPPKPSNKPEVVKYNVTGVHGLCFLASMGLQLNVTYQTKEKVKLDVFNLPPNVMSSGYCDNQTVILNLTSESTTLSFHFVQNTSTEKYFLQGIFLSMRLPSEATERTFNVSNNNLNALKASLGKSYKCVAEESIRVADNAFVNTFNIQVQAFKIDQGNFGAAEECPLDENNMLIPIVVGAALAGLVLIVLIAYLIGRKRSHAGYQTI
ncbi:lysosome-associated membrane glycoprotein 1 [Hemicordylus capensis]|uniref:lysosome-associated membrane glycoprotein 1 n=1 Tax=Hemicordylus capensis TaxID=884348 RepID=UPI002303D810|nr:lysosome-associated membrane glycoprotein 1 [Hemicordylus capensis]